MMITTNKLAKLCSIFKEAASKKMPSSSENDAYQGVVEKSKEETAKEKIEAAEAVKAFKTIADIFTEAYGKSAK